MIISIVLLSSTFVNDDSTSKETRTYPSSNTSGGINRILFAGSKESSITNSFCVSGFSSSVK